MVQQLLVVVVSLAAVLASGARLRAHPAKVSIDQKLSAIALNKNILSTLKAKAECNTHVSKLSDPSAQCVNLCAKEPDHDCVKSCDEVRVLICDPPAPTAHVVISDGQSAAVAAAAATAASKPCGRQ